MSGDFGEGKGKRSAGQYQSVTTFSTWNDRTGALREGDVLRSDLPGFSGDQVLEPFWSHHFRHRSKRKHPTGQPFQGVGQESHHDAVGLGFLLDQAHPTESCHLTRALVRLESLLARKGA